MSLRIDYTDRHTQHPASIKDYAVAKAEKVARFFDGVNHIQVILDRVHDAHSAEIVLVASHNMRFASHAAEPTVQAAIDRAVEKLERQVIKAKERLKDHRRAPRRE